MKIRWPALRLLVVCLCSAASALPAAAPEDARGQIQAEIERVQASARSQPAADEYWKDLAPLVTKSITRASEALSRGQLYFSLEELGKARVLLQAYENTQQSPELIKQGLAGFEAVWSRARVELTALDQKSHERVWAGKPAVLLALSETAQGKSLTLLEASRAYSSVTEAKAGYYYLGEAEAQADTARFYYSLELSEQKTRYAGHSILPQIERLQSQINAAFVPPRSIEWHRDFILLNSTLKVATELDAAKLYTGALYQYLCAVEQLARLNAGAEYSDTTRLRPAIIEAAKQLNSSRQDDSIAQLFLQRAQARAGEKESESAQKAAVIVNQVLPAYHAARRSAALGFARAARLVTVTLVRWPYT